MSSAIPISIKSGKEHTEKERVTTRPKKSKNSAGQSRKPRKSWQKPISARELAKQVNEVCTLLLNGEIDFEMAKRYVAGARTVAQLLSVEVYTARLGKRPPDIDLGEA